MLNSSFSFLHTHAWNETWLGNSPNWIFFKPSILLSLVPAFFTWGTTPPRWTSTSWDRGRRRTGAGRGRRWRCRRAPRWRRRPRRGSNRSVGLSITEIGIIVIGLFLIYQTLAVRHQFCQSGDAPSEETSDPDLPLVHEQRGEDHGAQDRVVDERGLSDGPEKDIEIVRREPRAEDGLVVEVLVHHAAVSQVCVPRILKGRPRSSFYFCGTRNPPNTFETFLLFLASPGISATSWNFIFLVTLNCRLSSGCQQRLTPTWLSGGGATDRQPCG